jgi:hypothetical protein
MSFTKNARLGCVSIQEEFYRALAKTTKLIRVKRMNRGMHGKHRPARATGEGRTTNLFDATKRAKEIELPRQP